jgi:FkbM family methyltransferase
MSDIFSLLVNTISERPDCHAPTSSIYQLLKFVTRESIAREFPSPDPKPVSFGPFGTLKFPYHRMGAIDSLDLFGLDEFIIFAFYNRNRSSYRRVADIGANLGLHSLVLSRSGFSVRSFEPDPAHAEIFRRNVSQNDAQDVELHEAAVSVEDGEAEFVRVLGNTTGSHLSGAKDSYGDQETFRVKVKAVQPLFQWADLIKMDAEGHEADMICSTSAADWKGTDMIVEIGNTANAERVFQHLTSLGVGMFSQKIGWRRVGIFEDMPTSHRDGSLFISLRNAMPW